ncbi:carboxypeptidase regulatory-like domain-containing protein [Neobacillus notoginsengisoli]|uniref:carboxypeptidase regulatory-like domain-containing protein n=1 Tax=Neobacillus notoginsengisoli TaxID=1578198 RepID=UPI001314E7D4|nr:carboxypeptidase regulatory-like domain-containing protein [Neobacillus notoginsengisoli]
MSSFRKKASKRVFSVLLSVLVLLSTFAPQLALAAEGKPPRFSEEELVLEKKREKEAEAGGLEENKKEERQPESTSSKDELPDLLKGLGIEPPPLKDEKAPVKKEKAEASLQKAFEKSNEVDVIIRMKDQPDLQNIYPQVKQEKNRTEKLKAIKDHLTEKANNSQKGIQQALKAMESKGKAKQKQSLWIINGMSATVTKEALEELKKRDDIESITVDEILQLPEVTVEDTKPRLPEWGLEKIFAPKVWGNYGIKGEGIVVGIMDTGVDGNHEALKKNYRGHDGNHQYSWIDVSGDNYATPNDGNGHGTHVAGTAVGGGDGEPIGVAPGAEWIAAKIFSDGGRASTSGIHEAFQWFMAPGGDPSKAPHVVNNSWGNSNTYNLEFYEDVKAWIAAGIFPAFAAGNDGPGSQTVGSPGSFPESFTVGATDMYDQTASFSSRGPVFWQDSNGERKRFIKPDISAPGHQIYSAWPTKLNKGKYNTISGTSMATPHVTGAVALLYQANPNLTIDEAKAILKETVRKEGHMGTLPNDSYGEGIIDIYQAVTEAAFAGDLKGTVKDKDGEPLTATLEIEAEEIVKKISEQGTFSFKIREGSHQVKVTSFGYKPYEGTVVVKKGQVTSVDFVLQDAESYNVTGKVIDESGKPVPYAFLRLKNTPLTAIRTDGEGNFEIRKIPTGTYGINVSGEGIHGKSEELSIKQNTTVEIKVKKLTVPLGKEWTVANGNNARTGVSGNAIDVNSLEKSWEYSTESKGEILFSTPAAAGGKVVLTTDRGWVVGLDAKSGKEQWAVRIGSTNRSSPTIKGDTVYLSGGQDGKIYALDLKNGSIKWNTATGGSAVYESPIYHEGTLFVSSDLTANAQLYALNAETGAKLWSVKLGAPTYFGPSVGNGLIFIGSYDNQTIRALKIEDGTEVWQKRVSAEGIASKPAYSSGTLYFTGINFSTDAGTLYAVDAATGADKWKVPGIGDTQAASPIVYENMVIMGSSVQPNLRAFDKETGKEIWSNKDVGTTLNSGSVTANGLLFFASTNGSVSVLDVYTGERLKDMILPVYSTSGIPILPGQVILPYITGVESYQSPGIFEGVLTDKDGKPVQANLTVEETGESVKAKEEGSFALKHVPGEYTVRISLYGKKQVTEKVTFVSGYKLKKDYTLADAEKGSFAITVKDKRTSKVLDGVSVDLPAVGLNGVTDSDGIFAKEGVFEGTWDIAFSLGGFKDGKGKITIKPGETAVLAFDLQPIDIAVLNDLKGDITNLLEKNGYAVEERGWDVVKDIGRYRVLYLNGAYGTDGVKPTEAEVKNLVDEAKKHNVSLIFTDQWGSNYGSIHHLKDFYNNPADLGHDYSVGEVMLKIEADHPITKGYKVGNEVPVLVRHADFAWFNHYSGRTVGKIGATQIGYVGAGVAYQAVSENSAHLLLSSHSSAPWETTEGWQQGNYRILFNSLDYLFNAQYGKVSGTVADGTGNPLEASIEVVETGVKAKSGADGTFELFHDEGTFTVELRAKGLGTVTEKVSIAKGEPVTVNAVLGGSERGTLTGSVTDALSKLELAGVKVEVTSAAGEKVAEVQSAANGRFELTGLEEETYKLTFTKDGYIPYTQSVDVARHTGEIDVKLHTMPRVGVVGDHYSSDTNFKAFLKGYGISGIDVQPADLAEKMKDFDVVLINDPSSSSFTKAVFENTMKAADDAGTSVIFGEAYWSTSGLNHLVNYRKDPDARTVVRNTTLPAAYKVIEEHPIFNGFKKGDSINITSPAGATVASFKNYSGYPLAEVLHEDGASHGLGVAYKPRTENNVEVLMGGHGFSSYRGARDYTDDGKQIFLNAILWAANVKFPVIQGTVIDENGDPLNADIKVKGQPFSAKSDAATGAFSIALLEGDYELTVSAYGYKTKTVKAGAIIDGEPLSIKMDVAGDVGTINGSVESVKDGNAISGAKVMLVGKPRTTESNLQGQFGLAKVEPGTYTVRVEKEGFVRNDVEVKVAAGQDFVLNVKMLPSPTVGVVVDLTASGMTFKQYLEERGYIVEYLTYKDLDKLDAVDVVFANSDYNNNAIPTKADFKAFQEALDQKRKSVIWTGQAGGRGSIRYLQEYDGDPATVFDGTNKTGSKGIVKEDHPLTAGFKAGDEIEIPGKSGYYYGFDGYSGKTAVNFEQTLTGQKGSMVAYKGRTTQSVEILLANMTISHVFLPNDPTLFDVGREKLLMNAVNWAIAEKAPLVGELHGTIQNETGLAVKGDVFIKETGKKIAAKQDGKFFAGLEAGTYTVVVNAFGHHEKEFKVSIKNGQILNESFVLQSQNAGTVKGKLIDAATKNEIEGAVVEVLGTPVVAKTSATGQFELSLPDGSYEVRISATGYKPVFEVIKVTEGQETALNISMFVSEKIAVLASTANINRLKPFLEAYGYDVDFHIYTNYEPMIEKIADYKLIIVNDISSTMKDRFKEMIKKADEKETSLIFAGQYGYHSISELSNAFGDPKKVTSGFVDKELNIRVDENHAIFRGFEQGKEYPLLLNLKGAAQYSVYEGYSGTTLGNLTNPAKGDIGASVAYKFSSPNSVHILLSALQVGTYGNPADRWTDNAIKLYLNAIDYGLTASQGEIKGTVTDAKGKPIAGALVTIPGTSVKTATNSAGVYRIGIGIGTYEVKVQARGFVEQTGKVEIAETGSSAELNFTLESIEASDLSGLVVDKKTGDAVADAALTLIPEDEPDFKGTAVSGKDGSYVFENLLPGNYKVEVKAEGYLPQSFETAIGDKDVKLNLEMNAFEVAVLGDHNGNISSFLNSQGTFAEEKGWELLGQLDKYAAVVVNIKDGTKDQVAQLIKESDEKKVSLIFTGTWGVKEGSIQLLKEALGSPDPGADGYNEGAVYVKALEDHPVFEGLKADADGLVRIHAEKSPYAAFKNYAGMTLAELSVDGAEKGSAIAYDFRSKDHMHLLLSSFTATNIIGPERGWTAEGKQLFANAVRWSMDAEQQLPGAPVWDTAELKVKDEAAVVSGKADRLAKVNVYEVTGKKRVLLGSVEAGAEGAFSVELAGLMNGSHTLIAEAENFAGKTESVNAMKVIVIGKPAKKAG